jgi:hypothetical protein
VWVEPGIVEGEAGGAQLVEDRAQIAEQEVREQEAVAQRRPPAQQRLGGRLLPEACHQRAQQQLLDQAHACVRRHLEATEFDQTQASGRSVR